MHLIDIHCHILAGIDDGAQTVDESIIMAKAAMQDGIKIIVATPHVQSGIFDNRKSTILEKVRKLNMELKALGIDILVLPGAEYRLEANLPQRLADGELMTLNNKGRHILIEFPSNLIPPFAENILYEIQLQGVTPIIAHPERNTAIIGCPDIMIAYTKREILAQITSASITGFFGKSIEKAAWKLMNSGAGHFLGSDGHSPTGRKPLLSKAFREVEKRLGSDYSELVANRNSNLMLRGHYVPSLYKTENRKMWGKN